MESSTFVTEQFQDIPQSSYLAVCRLGTFIEQVRTDPSSAERDADDIAPAIKLLDSRYLKLPKPLQDSLSELATLAKVIDSFVEDSEVKLSKVTLNIESLSVAAKNVTKWLKSALEKVSVDDPNYNLAKSLAEDVLEFCSKAPAALLRAAAYPHPELQATLGEAIRAGEALHLNVPAMKSFLQPPEKSKVKVSWDDSGAAIEIPEQELVRIEKRKRGGVSISREFNRPEYSSNLAVRFGEQISSLRRSILSWGARPKSICCSFCGRTQEEVRKIVAGPNVYICNECVDLCADIVAEEL